jgi:hypothetical protein
MPRSSHYERVGRARTALPPLSEHAERRAARILAVGINRWATQGSIL